MQINEVCKLTGLTKKAISWYENNDLISVRKDQNGYRTFSKSDVNRLKEIYILRSLDISTKDIKQIIDSSDKSNLLAELRKQKENESFILKKRIEIIDRLIVNYDLSLYNDVKNEWMSKSIGEKLRFAFPGFWGKYIASHFGAFLKQPIGNSEQQMLYDKAIDWIDNNRFKEPFSYKFINKISKLNSIKQENISEKMSEQMLKSVYDEEGQKELLANYEKYSKMEKKLSFKLNPIYILSRFSSNSLRKQLTKSGYYDQFIPIMRKLSPSYDDYLEKLELINKIALAGQL